MLDVLVAADGKFHSAVTIIADTPNHRQRRQHAAWGEKEGEQERYNVTATGQSGLFLNQLRSF